MATALLMSAALLFSTGAVAQWQWVDDTGRKVFSNTPPPAGTPERSILKRPGPRPAPALAPAAEQGESAEKAAAAPAVPAPPVRDEALEARKRQAEAAEAEKRKAEEARIAQRRADNCERAQRAKSTLDSGIRMATVNAKGERAFMDDAARSAETQRLAEIIRNDCGPVPTPTVQ